MVFTFAGSVIVFILKKKFGEDDEERYYPY